MMMDIFMEKEAQRKREAYISVDKLFKKQRKNRDILNEKKRLSMQRLHENRKNADNHQTQQDENPTERTYDY